MVNSQLLLCFIHQTVEVALLTGKSGEAVLVLEGGLPRVLALGWHKFFLLQETLLVSEIQMGSSSGASALLFVGNYDIRVINLLLPL